MDFCSRRRCGVNYEVEGGKRVGEVREAEVQVITRCHWFLDSRRTTAARRQLWIMCSVYCACFWAPRTFKFKYIEKKIKTHINGYC